MAQEIGTAYVTVQPSAEGFSRKLEGDISGGVARGTESAGGKLKNLAGKVLKWGTGAVVATGAAITGLALKGGFARAMNIENAQAKLAGLGHSTKSVDRIMENALQSVLGTAYSLDEAAVTAASAVAAGIKPGQELERYLTLTADAATIAGTSMGEMGDIFNKVQSNQKLTMKEVNMLTARGVPILQMLADEYGVTAEEMSKMVSNGEVDAERFRKAIEEKMGGAALKSGDTTQGAFKNMMAALDRFGATLIGPVYANAKTFFGEMITFIDGVHERLKPFVEAFSAAFSDKIGTALDGAGEKALAFLDRMLGIEGGVGNVMETVGGKVQTLGSAFSAVLPIVGRLALGVAGPVGFIVGLFAQMITQSSKLRESIKSAFTRIGSVVKDNLKSDSLVTFMDAVNDVARVLGDALATALDLAVPLIESLINGLVKLAEWFGKIADSLGPELTSVLLAVGLGLAKIGPIIAGVKGIIGTFVAMGTKLAGVFAFLKPVIAVVTSVGGKLLALGAKLAGVFKLVGGALGALFTPVGLVVAAVVALAGAFIWAWNNVDGFADFFIGIWEKIKDVAQSVADWFTGTLVPAISSAWDWLMEVTQPLRDVMVGVWEDIQEAVGSVLAWFTDTLVPMFTGMWETISASITGFIEWISPYWTEFWTTFQEVVQLVWEFIEPLITLAMENIQLVITTAMEIISEVWQVAWDLISTVFSTVWNVITTVVETAMGVIQGVINLVLAVIQGDWSGAWNAIKSIASIVWNGIRSVVTSVINGIRNVITTVMNTIRNIWNTVWNTIKSVASTAINTVRSVITSVINGIKNTWQTTWNTVKTAFTNVWNGIKTAARTSVNTVHNIVRRVKTKILGVFNGAGSWLKESGRKIISGLTDGIKNAFSGAVDAVKEGLGRVRNLLPFSPAKEGPFSGRGWTLYSGESIVDALAEGVRAKEGTLVSAMSNVLGASHDVLGEWDSMNMYDTSWGGGGYAAGSGVQYVDNRTVYNPVAEPDSIQVERNLQKAAAYVGGLA